jgi:hypothetical protein
MRRSKVGRESVAGYRRRQPESSKSRSGLDRNRLSVHDRQQGSGSENLGRIANHEVVIEYREVGELARGDRTQMMEISRGVGGSRGERRQGLVPGQPLLRGPTRPGRSVRLLPGHRCVEAQKWIM